MSKKLKTMHNLILHYLKGKSLAIAMIAFMLICQAFVFCAISYGVDAAIRMEEVNEARALKAASFSR
jgi:hypothetical protein